MKRCGKCKRRRRLAAFANDRKRKDGLYPYCRDCQSKYAAKWRAENHERELRKARARYQLPATKKYKREWHLQRAYGISLQEYHAMRHKQRGLCLICLRYFGNKLVVDHDHTTGRVRGLLCINCNADIRLFENDPAIFRRVLKYLAK